MRFSNFLWRWWDEICLLHAQHSTSKIHPYCGLVLLSIQQEHTHIHGEGQCVYMCCRTEIRSDSKSNQYPHESAEKRICVREKNRSILLVHLQSTDTHRTFDDSKYNYTHFLLPLTDVHSISLFHLSRNLTLFISPSWSNIIIIVAINVSFLSSAPS